MSIEGRPTAVELAAAFGALTLSPVEAAKAALSRIAALDPAVNAFVLVDAESALRAAAESERRWRAGRPLSPVDGIPTTVKDIFLTAGWPTLRGSWLVEEAAPWREDAPAVARLREAGAVLLGKTTTPEFAWKGVTDSDRFGATANPWDTALTAGGSSGGSAAAVALGMGAWSIGSDGGGSVRIPAAFTGTVAFKPTYGLVPHYPVSPFGTLAHVGPMTTTVADAALLLDVLVGFDPRDWSALPTPSRSFLAASHPDLDGVRIGYAAQPGRGGNDPEVEEAVHAAAALLGEAGAAVTELDLRLPESVEAFHALWFSGAAKVLQSFGANRSRPVDPGLLAAAEAGRAVSGSDYLDATTDRMSLGQSMQQLHLDYDVLLTPTVPITAFDLNRDVPSGSTSPFWTGWTPYTYPFNMTQQPALTVPCGFSADGLPIGLRIVGPRHGDAVVLRVGRAFQELTDWAGKLPPLLTTQPAVGSGRPEPRRT